MKSKHIYRLIQTKIKPEQVRHLIVSLYQRFLVFSLLLLEIQRKIIKIKNSKAHKIIRQTTFKIIKVLPLCQMEQFHLVNE